MLQQRLDVIVQEGGRYYVYSETTPRKRLGGPYKTRGEAEKRLAQVEYFKAHRQDLARAYGMERNLHPRNDDGSLVDNRARIVQQVLTHRQLMRKPPPLRRRVPNQMSPKTIAVDYAKVLVAMIRRARDAYQPLLDATKAVKTDARADADDKKLSATEAKRLLDEAGAKLSRAVDRSQIDSLADKFAARTSTYQRVQLGRQVRSALGVDPFLHDRALARQRQDFVAKNVSLITRIPKRLHEKVEGVVMNALDKSDLNKTLAGTLSEQFGIAERHAHLIARDQINKFYGAVNKTRQRELGVSKFIWRTVEDQRVRESHADLDGQTFSWDDLPTDEDTGEEIYPGSPINCRCSAEPVLDSLVDDVDTDDSDVDTSDDVDTDEEDDGSDDEGDDTSDDDAVNETDASIAPDFFGDYETPDDEDDTEED